MRKSFLDWPKLLGGVVGLEGFGLALWQGRYLALGRNDAFEEFVLGFAILLAVLSFGLFCAQNWARWGVVGLGAVFGTGLIILTGLSVAHNWALRQEWARHQVRLDDFLDAFSEIGIGLCFLAPIALLVLALCHRDVAAAFRPKKDRTTLDQL